ncbi:hypothetical protein [Bradyrhizobium sp. 23AC]
MFLVLLHGHLRVDNTAPCCPSVARQRLAAKFAVLAVNALQTVGRRLQDTQTRVLEMSREPVEQRVSHAVTPFRAGRRQDRPGDRYPASGQPNPRCMAQRELVEGGRQWIVLRNLMSRSGLPRPAEAVSANLNVICAGSRSRSRNFLEIDPVFAVGLVDRVEGRDQAAGEMHAEIEGDSYARRRTLYDCVDNQLDGRERDLYHGASLRVWRCRLLC